MIKRKLWLIIILLVLLSLLNQQLTMTKKTDVTYNQELNLLDKILNAQITMEITRRMISSLLQQSILTSIKMIIMIIISLMVSATSKNNKKSITTAFQLLAKEAKNISLMVNNNRNKLFLYRRVNYKIITKKPSQKMIKHCLNILTLYLNKPLELIHIIMVVEKSVLMTKAMSIK